MFRSVLFVFAVACAPLHSAPDVVDSDGPETERGVRAFACPAPTSELPEYSPMRYVGITETEPATPTGLDQLNAWIESSDQAIRHEVDVLIVDAVVSYAAGDLVWLQGPWAGVRAYDVPELRGMDVGTRVDLRVTELASYYGNIEITQVADVLPASFDNDVWVQDGSRASFDVTHVGQVAKAYGQVIDTWTGPGCQGTCALVSNEAHSWFVDSAVDVRPGACVKHAGPVSWSSLTRNATHSHEGPVFDGQVDGALEVYAYEALPTCSDSLPTEWGAMWLPTGVTEGMTLDADDDTLLLDMQAGQRCTVRVNTLNGAEIDVSVGDVAIESDTDDRGMHELVVHNPFEDATLAPVNIQRLLAPMCTPYTIDVSCD